MRIVPAAHQSVAPVPLADDPIEWFFYEERGPATSNAGRWSQLTIEAWAGSGGQSVVTDGRMSYPHDPGIVEDRYYAYPDFTRDGVDPGQAMDHARAGVEQLVTALDRGAGESAKWLVPRFARVPRNPEEVDVWIRRTSGARERYLIPFDQLPAGMRDARTAAASFAATVRRDFISFAGEEMPA